MRTLLLIGASLALTSAAFATEQPIRLEVMAGKVFMQSATGLALLKKGAAAILNAAESGCVVSLRQPGVYVVPNLADCAPGQAAVLKSSAVIEPANGTPDGGYPDVGYPDVAYPDVAYPDAGVLPPPPPEAPVSGFLVGTGFAATVAAVVVYNMVIQDEEPATPVSSY
jgi:hypothetical protein